MSDDDTPEGPDAGRETACPGSAFRSRAHRRRALAVIGGICVAMLSTSAVLWVATPQVLDPLWLRRRLEAVGPLAPVAFVSLQALQAIVAPIPGQVLAGVGGYLFGTRLGTLYSMLGVVIGSTVVFTASKRYGRLFAAQVLAPETLARFDGFVAEYGTVGLFVAFLLPTFPDDALCALAGLTELHYRRFLVLLVVGRTPTFFAAALAGTSTANGEFTHAGLVVAVLSVVSVAVYYFRGRLSSGRTQSATRD